MEQRGEEGEKLEVRKRGQTAEAKGLIGFLPIF